MNSIILLHGALGTSDQLKPIAERLDLEQSIHLMNFEGHGSESTPDRPFRMEHFVENVIDFMDQHAIEKADFFGYSMGGYVAMMLAKDHPGKVGKVATLGTVLKWSSEVAEREVKFLNPDKIREKVPAFAAELENRHPAGWENVAAKTKDLLLDLGKNPRISDSEWSSISHKVRIHTGDRDATAGIGQSLDVCKKLPNGELMVLPDTPHPIERANLNLLISSLNDFLTR
ncbi:alpha/beta fold hydrolase [Rhodohalobacter barkolensis]|uniref:Alpha/beta hydrolase n=1 Tax=Rhodohalobacter barkolensis TaxID=2053187 RepID=A0A2N0VHQ9_9BACT|nr:alpha/beta hydrolase [Rhodohalobacter barkolensis]PKD43736.1 alpha/beta hydrolase [Rhodohalobacter barkolensis]